MSVAPVGNNSTPNATTVSPEVAAFVSNTRELIIAGSVTGGILILVIGVVIICCRCIQRRTSDEAKERKRIKRKKEFERRKETAAEEAERLEAKRARNAGKVRKGRIAAYDETLAKSFSNVMGLLGRKSTSGGKPKEDISDAEEEGDHDETVHIPGAPSPLRFGDSDSIGSPERMRSVSVVEVPDGNGNSPPSDATAMIPTNTFEDLDALSAPVPHRSSGLITLGSIRRLPMPRSTQEEIVMYGSKHSLFDAAVNAHLEDERRRQVAAEAASMELAARQRREMEARANDARQVTTGLRSGASTQRSVAAMLQEQVDDTEGRARKQRLMAISTQDYFKAEL